MFIKIHFFKVGCGQVVIVAVKGSDDCGMVDVWKRGRVCRGLWGEIKYGEITCWSVSCLLYWVREVWCSVVYGRVLAMGMGMGHNQDGRVEYGGSRARVEY